MAFIEARGIVKSYAVGGSLLTVLRDLDVDVASGEMVAIMGASGVGKSTLLHVLGGLDRAERGTVVVDNTQLTTLPDGEVVAFRNKSFANPEGLIAFIREEGTGVKLQPDHRLIYYADWGTPEERLAGTRDLLRRLVDIAGQVKKAA